MPELPSSRGPIGDALLAVLRGGAGPSTLDPAVVDGADPFGEDLQLALYCAYELHYRGFDGVSDDPAADDLEWDPSVLGLRRAMERVFLDALRAAVPASDGSDLDEVLAGLLVEPVTAHGVSHHLRRDGEEWQVREYVVHRSLYHLKEADPQAWVIPRLDGEVKAALVTVEHDEYGAGDPVRMHARLFADMMASLGLDDRYGAYLDAVPAPVLAEVNLMSLCGLHRRLRGALVGQFATVELTSSPGSDRLVRAMRRLGLPDAAVEFYSEHVEADAVHEQLVRRGVVAPMVAAEPELAADVVFGIRASCLLADRTDELLLESWTAGHGALRVPLPGMPEAPAA
ncbi:iron-containing redox enzyme family protein [Pseudonocardia sp. KRD-184]|uniref:Iron-containing redox enzyme family protein n=1 Tax=Pseudonocardia oceani TaxID=2792013 RepID=A0ABS6UJ36_9PSEU|nr:iron-containing redox enzyme family protein [Pseudonocardia oceani]MBW0092974.1 iron-containing redox enzyme family protein [Pseudonocardia oceani]MBW0099701.1 iron-containing redox enzyme family protein [Pseudonocardia oceani]MBW0109346.1 iron-containing redox enzyme family protein [Pseudonocardia oceani]MBW0123086.1 iron-containing redox enzyme family protein [Pseudonocardia oceani]MBW0131849.1 iron-containing redox enzyme family protein [Pseudonocardia oceani]